MINKNCVMKKLFYILILVVALISYTSCSNDKDDNISVKPSATGTMTDKEGNEYKWVRIDKLDWMAENLKCGMPYYDLTAVSDWGWLDNVVVVSDLKQAKQYLADFGNYYSYQQALDNCPAGWRLPSDQDWKQLEMALGMKHNNAEREGWRDGAASLMIQSIDQGTGLNLRFGGELCKWGNINDNDKTVKPYRQYDEGMYWTSTVDSTMSNPCVFYRKIMPQINKVERRSATTFAHYFCVRYVRDVK